MGDLTKQFWANGYFLTDGGKLLYLVNALRALRQGPMTWQPCPERSNAMSLIWKAALL